MHWIDIVVLLILLISVFIGLWHGFVHEILSLLSWIAAFTVARVFAPDTGEWLEQFIVSDALILLLSWLIPFIGTFLIFNLFRIFLIGIINMTGLRPIDRLLGAAFGVLKGVLLVTAGVLVIQLVLSRSSTPFKTESKLVPHFQVIALWMLKTLEQQPKLSLNNVVDRLGEMIDSGVDNIDINSWQEKLGMSKDEIKAILNDDKKLEQLQSIINDPEAIEKLKSAVMNDDCEKENCD